MSAAEQSEKDIEEILDDFMEGEMPYDDIVLEVQARKGGGVQPSRIEAALEEAYEPAIVWEEDGDGGYTPRKGYSAPTT
ncbi:MAG: hypothetical protein ABEJ64_01710 [Candidatus Nanohaloarchaea archaeon]